MEIASLFDKGGPVMWILAGYSLIAVTIILERLIRFSRLQTLPEDFEHSVLSHNLKTGIAVANDAGSGPEQTIALGILEASHKGITDLSRVASRIGSEQLRRLESGLPTLAWLGNTAPLLGLFGTITGMISAFQVIESTGGRVDAQALAGGIWEAMVTTGAGLAVAIPILFALHLLEGMVERRAERMQGIASILIENLPHRQKHLEKDAIHHMESAASHAI